jgi:hypothetical protein
VTVYLDTMGHLGADSFEELHEFAQKIGLKREWFQANHRYKHYDIVTESKRRRAVKAGALLVPPTVLLHLMFSKGLWTPTFPSTLQNASKAYDAWKLRSSP